MDYFIFVEYARYLDEHQWLPIEALLSIEARSVCLKIRSEVSDWAIFLANTLRLNLSLHSLSIDETWAVSWVFESRICAVVIIFDRFRDDSYVENRCSFVPWDGIEWDLTWGARQSDCSLLLNTVLAAYGIRAAHVSEGILVQVVSRLLYEVIVRGVDQLERYWTDHYQKHHDHQLSHDLKVRVKSIA